MTIKALSDRYLNDHLFNRGSYYTTKRLLRNTFGQIENISVHMMTPSDVLTWHRSLSKTPYQANRALGTLRSMIRWGMRLSFCYKDPTTGVQRYPVKTRSRFLTREELKRLHLALRTAEPKIALFVRLVLATGCRRSEARNAAMSHIDLLGGHWLKPHTKSGDWQIVPLSSHIIDAIKEYRQEGDWLFPGENGQPWSLAGIEKAWGRLRRSCNLNDVRLHDLRRTAASHMAIHGENLSTIQKMLNHSSLQTTAIYARLDLRTLSKALQRNSNRLFPARRIRHADRT